MRARGASGGGGGGGGGRAGARRRRRTAARAGVALERCAVALGGAGGGARGRKRAPAAAAAATAAATAARGVLVGGGAASEEAAAVREAGFGLFERHTRGVGLRVLARSGWRPGEGLGKRGQGRALLLRPASVTQSKGWAGALGRRLRPRSVRWRCQVPPGRHMPAAGARCKARSWWTSVARDALRWHAE